MDKRQADRIRTVAETTSKSAAQIHRELQPELPDVSYESVRRLTAQIRGGSARPPADRSPAGMADRILTLLDRDLTALERHRGKTDLERLDRIAATLRRVEAIRPKGEEKRASSLRSLLPSVEPQASTADLNGSE